MRWRIIIFLAVVGIILIVWGVGEWHLGRGASAKPDRISLKQLIARGPEGNPNIILTDFELGENFVYEEENGRWTEVYVPAIPAGEPKLGAAPGERPATLKAVIISTHVHSKNEIGPVLGKRELPALVTNRIRSLGTGEKDLLIDAYGGAIDVNNCLIIQEGRSPMSGALLALIFGGGVLLLLGAFGVTGFEIVRSWKSVTEQAAARRRRRLQERDDEPSPKRRRRRDEDEP